MPASKNHSTKNQIQTRSFQVSNVKWTNTHWHLGRIEKMLFASFSVTNYRPSRCYYAWKRWLFQRSQTVRDMYCLSLAIMIRKPDWVFRKTEGNTNVGIWSQAKLHVVLLVPTYNFIYCTSSTTHVHKCIHPNQPLAVFKIYWGFQLTHSKPEWSVGPPKYPWFTQLMFRYRGFVKEGR